MRHIFSKMAKQIVALASAVRKPFCSAVSLHNILLVCASGETLQRRFLDALKATVDFCFLGK